jgi:hypothetical protein
MPPGAIRVTSAALAVPQLNAAMIVTGDSSEYFFTIFSS